MKNISTALLKAQSEMSNPKKGATNPFFKSKYADLNAIREAVIPTLNENGISVLQPIVHVDGKNFVKTILLHESGELMESLTEIIYNKQNDAQAQGSGISYARRYVQSKPQATKEVMQKAKTANATLEQIKSKYSVSSELETYFFNL
jgi:hypothetical protein